MGPKSTIQVLKPALKLTILGAELADGCNVDCGAVEMHGGVMVATGPEFVFSIAPIALTPPPPPPGSASPLALFCIVLAWLCTLAMLLATFLGCGFCRNIPPHGSYATPL